MIARRNLLTRLGLAHGAIVTATFAQKAIVQNGQAIVCSTEAVKCPNGHPSCKSINAPLVVGNDDRNYPDQAQLYSYHVLRCETCHVLFTRE